VSIALDKQQSTEQPSSNQELEQLAYYLLQEIQSEIDLGSKVANGILYRAFARLEKGKAKPSAENKFVPSNNLLEGKGSNTPLVNSKASH
jgi:hypothetical protein